MSRRSRTHVPTGQLQPDAGRLVDRGRQPAAAVRARRGSSSRVSARRASAARRWSRSATFDGVSVRGQSTAGQVQHEQVDRATGQQAAGDRQPLVQAGRGDDHEPLESKAAGDRLDRVEAARQVQPGDDRPLRLGFRGDPHARASSGRWSRRPGWRRWPRSAGRPGRGWHRAPAKPVRTTRSPGSGLMAGRRVRLRPARAPGPAPRGPAELPHPSEPGGPRRRGPQSPRGVVIGRLD